MYKVVLLLLSIFMTSLSVNAESITRTISSLGVNKSAVAVSVKDVETGNVVYSLNAKAPMVPASTLKIVTSAASVEALGKDAVFSTKLYKSTNNDLYLKLSGDPQLTTADLEQLISVVKEKQISPKHFYVDDSVFDKVEWGEGWQWDDDLNPLMPKFSAYNINGNVVRVEIAPTTQGAPASIRVKPFYPISFINQVETDITRGNDIKLSRNNSIAPNLILAEGFASKTYVTSIPVNNTKLNFNLQLESAIRNKKMEYYDSIIPSVLPNIPIYLVDEVNHEIMPMVSQMLKTSNNLVAESLFKYAGSVWSDTQGSAQNSISMLNSYLKKFDIDTSDVRVVDGSGVSKNNLVTADFMSNFLLLKSKQEDFDEFKSMLPAPGEGTLKNRMLYLKDSLNAKTGTLSDASAIAGYLVSRRGKVYAFDIMINDAKTSSVDKKNIEEQIIRNIYANY